MNQRTARSALFAALVVTACVLAGCSSSDPSPGPEASGDPTTTSTEASAPGGVPVTSAPRQSCDGNNLAAAAAAALPGASLTELVCEPSHAVATWATGPDGETAVLFALQGGVWVYVASGPAGGDVAALAPAGFSPTAVPAWQRLRAAIASRATPAPDEGGAPGGGGGGGGATTSTVYYTNSDTGLLESCSANGDGLICKPAPSIPPTTVDPENPDATVPPSGFCRFNYNDPRCQADNQYEP